MTTSYVRCNADEVPNINMLLAVMLLARLGGQVKFTDLEMELAAKDYRGITLEYRKSTGESVVTLRTEVPRIEER